ncbi:hypothetical protein E3T41_01520 [Cryobacterium sp. Hh38]|nr:hypothetical protein E3T41_01520 [Cryobacterium sp. Hh38]
MMPTTAEHPQNALTDADRGRYLVTTASATCYSLDLDARVLRRVASAMFNDTLSLRRDGDDVDLLEIVTCCVGNPMVVLINLHVPGVWLTTRETTRVVSIEPISEPPQRP